MKKVVYSGGSAFVLPETRRMEGLSVWQTGPRQLIEINNGRVTPYSERRCNGCHKLMAFHWQRPVKMQDVTRWFCYRDGTAYAGANHNEL